MAVGLSDPQLVLKLCIFSTQTKTFHIVLSITQQCLSWPNCYLHRCTNTQDYSNCIGDRNEGQNTAATTKRPNIDATHCTAALSVNQLIKMFVCFIY